MNENYGTNFFFRPTVFHGESAAIFSFEKTSILKEFLHIRGRRYRYHVFDDILLDAKSDGNEIFWKLENFTISWNKVRVQPFSDQVE